MAAGTRPTVVVGMDGSDAAQAAVEYAADLAARRRLPLRVLHAFEASQHELLPARGWHRDRQEVLRRAAQQMLDQTREVLSMACPDLEVQTQLQPGSPVQVLVEESRHADSIVVGRRGAGGFTPLLLGSTPFHLCAQASCPVVAVPAPEVVDQERREVVVGVDGSAGAERALEYAFQAAAETGQPLVAVRVWSEPGQVVTGLRISLVSDRDEVERHEEEQLSSDLASWAGKFPEVRVEPLVVAGHPAEVLLWRARTARLLVVGSRGRSSLRNAMFGSVSHAVVHHANGPVAVVPAGI
jgi:nucleotide-binding universal stress UspA family protein